jgi:transposase
MDLLALQEVKAVNCRDLGGSYLIDAECTTFWCCCPKCDSDELYDHASREVDYTDTPLHGMPCLIRLRRKRQRCKKCKHVMSCATEHFDDDFRMTIRCAQWIEEQAIDRTFSDIAEDWVWTRR